MKVVNAQVTAQISEIAKENNYNIVLSKAVVVFGCDDITEIIENTDFITVENIDSFLDDAIEKVKSGGSFKIQLILTNHKAKLFNL